MLILSSPSGAGKTTLTRLLLQNRDVDLTLSVSVTTRQRRSSEADGIHYHFITPDRFDEMRERNELLEHAQVHGNSYGTPRAPVEQAAGPRTGCPVRHRLPGHAAGARQGARGRRDDLHPAALDPRAAGAARAARRGPARDDREAARGGPQRDHPLEQLRLRAGQRRPAEDVRRHARDPRGRAPAPDPPGSGRRAPSWISCSSEA